jgi:tRNA nucleotidyltransferase (CCA-adding enzyme)
VAHRLSSSPSLGRSEVYSLLHPLPAEFILYAMGRTEEERVKKAISLYFTELKRVRVSLTGKDLKKMGVIPGPVYTEIFQHLLRRRLEEKISSRQEEIDYVAKEYFPGRAAPAARGKGRGTGLSRDRRAAVPR